MPSLVGSEMCIRDSFWSGGTFIYVPKGVKVDIPLQTYFRINNEATAQFERTLIIVDEGASVHYVEAVSYTHLRAHETRHDLVCRLLLEKKKKI